MEAADFYLVAGNPVIQSVCGGKITLTYIVSPFCHDHFG